MYQCLNKKWFIAQVKPNSYDTATQNLERQGFKTFLPKMQIAQRKTNKVSFKSVYVFPGYVFVCFDPRLVPWTKINSTYGVSKILSFNNKPSEISSHLIQDLKIRYEINSNRTEKLTFKVGDTVGFYKGPFADLIAKIENIDAKNRIWVLLDAMGGNRRLKLKNKQEMQFFKIS